MEINVQPYTDNFSNEWDEFVKNRSRNGGIFHERLFLSYHPKEKFVDKSLLFFDEKQKLVAVFPAVAIQEGEKTKIVSHSGSSAGGIIYHKRATLREVLGVLEATIHYYKTTGVSSLELRLAEPIFADPSHDELTYLLWHRGFRIASREISSCVKLTEEKEWVAMGRERNIRYAKSLQSKGYEIIKTDDIPAVYRLMEKNLGERYQKKPTHTLAELQDLSKKYPERIDFWLVREKGRDIAGMVLFEFNEQGIHDFYTSQDYTFAKEQVLPFLYYHVFDFYAKKGYHWFNIGISSRGDLIKWGILEFKEKTGARASFRENWILDDIEKYSPYALK